MDKKNFASTVSKDPESTGDQQPQHSAYQTSRAEDPSGRIRILKIVLADNSITNKGKCLQDAVVLFADTTWPKTSSSSYQFGLTFGRFLI